MSINQETNLRQTRGDLEILTVTPLRLARVSADETFEDFDVSSASSELTVSLFGRKLEAPTGKQEVTSLGWFKLRPLLEPWVPGEQWVDVEDGTGQLRLEVSFLERDVPPLGDSGVWSGVWSVRREVRLGDLVRVEKCDTNRTFAMRTIRAPDTVPCPETVCRIEHPFVAPLEFALESPQGLSLLSPVASGGYLFSYLQRERRFELDKAKMYIAELTCALESLHSRLKQPVYPKPENIALDAFGHVSLCSPGLFGLDGEKDGAAAGSGEGNTGDIPAPELLLGHEVFKAVDWWSLGILLYEMLTGLPPFYNADIQEQRNQIINQVLHLPEGLPTAAGDFLMKLLDKDPVTRLGANGASEVKAHTFFDGVDWPALMQPRREVLFDPSEDETVFRLEPDELRDSRLFHETGVQRVSEEGVLEKQILWTPVFRIEFWYPVNDKDEEEDALEKASSGLEDDEWELEWDPETQVFRFDNRVTGEKRPVQSDRQPTSTSPPDCDPAAKSPRPSQSQKKDALKAAMEARYSNRTVSQILGYDVDLDDAIIPRAIRAYGPFVPGLHDNSDDGWRTPLEWATDTGNAALSNGRTSPS
ncbi:hypothetical protein NEMBOFW57_002941 [Staphylotrichum longicolle]|uniref:Protein kinase domain-containing protein n=1 Tax=Staphylotrichum longicolle TaxID=669026 RepID=A0AAD4F4F8_9PEZI|nr:hypothetical protein NEMBOFW57_002941 [Staphylotrichum longicolle]